MKKPEQFDPLAETQRLRDDKASKVTQSDDETAQFRTLTVEDLEGQAARDKTPQG